MSTSPVIIGYSGHAYVILAALRSIGISAEYYLDREEKVANPFGLSYAGNENSHEGEALLRTTPYFIAIGNNQRRSMIDTHVSGQLAPAIIHRSAVADAMATISEGAFIGPGAVVNPVATVGRCAIVNSSAVVEHECQVADYAHIAPGAVLLGNVSVGARTLIGGNAVILPGVSIGADCTIGAGAVIRHDVPDGTIMVGNPARPL